MRLCMFWAQFHYWMSCHSLPAQCKLNGVSASLGVASTPTNIKLISLACFFVRGIVAFLDFRTLHFHSAIIFINWSCAHLWSHRGGGGEFVIERVWNNLADINIRSVSLRSISFPWTWQIHARQFHLSFSVVQSPNVFIICSSPLGLSPNSTACIAGNDGVKA